MVVEIHVRNARHHAVVRRLLYTGVLCAALLSTANIGFGSVPTIAMSDEAAQRMMSDAQAHIRTATDSYALANNPSEPAADRVAAILPGLTRELHDPAPNVGGSDRTFTQSEVAQGVYLDALILIGDGPALRDAASRQPDNQVRAFLLIAAAHVSETAPESVRDELIPQIIEIMKTAPSDFVRMHAAGSLGYIAGGKDTRAEAIAALKEALDDPQLRWQDWGAGKGVYIHLVPGGAAGSLMRLGVNVQKHSDGSWTVLTGDNPDTVWISARPFLSDQGYTLRWEPSEKRLDAKRGNALVRLWAGRREAEINGKMVPLPATPQIVNSILRIPDTLQNVIANGGQPPQ